MTAKPLKISASDIDACMRDLPAELRGLPKPAKVEVFADSDFEGDPIIRMIVTYPETVGVEETAWKKVNPLLSRLRALVYRKANEELPVIAQIQRLAETSAA